MKLLVLNSTAFAGYTDWRLPNRNELESLVEIESPSLAIDAVFDNGACHDAPVPSTTGCTVLECSCTVTGFYWTSSSYQKAATWAWAVSFLDGGVGPVFKTDAGFVRAVRGG